MFSQRVCSRVAALVAAVTLVVTQGASAQPLNLLFFGNSFSQGGPVPSKVGSIAVADGYLAPLIVDDLQGGQDFDYHLGQVNSFPQNNVNHSSIAGKTWDFVIMQGYSTEATTTLGDGTFVADAVALYGAVLNHSSGRGAGVTSILYETWARRDLVTNNTFPSLTNQQAQIRNGYAAAEAGIAAAYTPLSVRTAPVGDAFESVGFPISLYAGDNYHASTAGSLLASLVIYRTIYKEDVGDIPYSAVSSFAGVNSVTWSNLTTIADSMAIPEPGSVSMLAVGVASLLRRRRR